jgi:carboxypeptidase family protein
MSRKRMFPFIGRIPFARGVPGILAAGCFAVVTGFGLASAGVSAPAAAPAESTGSISGRVVDENGSPLSQGFVILREKSIGGVIDSIGTFRLPKVPPGTYTLRVSRRGYGTIEKGGVQVAAGKMATVDVTLEANESNSGTPTPGTPVYSGRYWPCDRPWGVESEEESPVQIGVRSEANANALVYTYKVLNRSRDTLTEVRIGNNGHRCELTGAGDHVVPDTAFGPPGWRCAPVQGKDVGTFALSWKAAPGDSNGILPGSATDGFRVVLRRSDSLYLGCHWFVVTDGHHEYSERVRPSREVDAIPIESGTIAGRVTDLGEAPISDARVSIRRADLESRSTTDGAYAISAVPVGTYTLSAGARDYGSCGRAQVCVAARETTRVDFHLSKGALVIPIAYYATARERLELPFPKDAVDTRGSRFIDRGTPIPPRSAGDSSDPGPFVYSLTNRDVEVVYRGLGQDTASRAFVANVRRDFRNPAEERLLRIAEETYPPAQAVASIASLRSTPTDLAREERLWWFDEFDGVRLPYAVTMDAVRYYLGLTQALGRGDSTQTHGIRMKRCKFSYSAQVSAGPTHYTRGGRRFEDVYVIEMKLSWSNYCGPLCACWVDLDRTVLIRADGTVVWIFGDRKPDVMVS